MLTKLSVKNFAIIEDAEIDFKPGLTVLTGETGAGKSLIIDSISLLLGERASLEMIRNGEDKASISGVFTFKNPKLSSYLRYLDIEEDGTITITRNISSNKSTIKVNEKYINLSELKEIAKYVADIHEQFDMIKLLNKDNYLDIIDGFRFELINKYKDNYLEKLEHLKEKEAAYARLSDKIAHIKAERDTYEYELDELEKSELDINEEKEIESRIELLKNYDKIYALLGESKELMDGSLLTDLYRIKENVEELGKYQSEYEEIYSSLNDRYYELEDIFDELKRKFNRLDYNPNELDELETRKNYLNQLKKKYKKDIPELIAYKDELQNLIKSDEDLDIALEECKNEFIEAYHETFNAASELSDIRQGISKNIEKELMEILKDLALQTKFEIYYKVAKEENSFNTMIFKESGIDEVDFLIETNEGEGIKPLSKIVSGGEMSRIMLAVKMLFIKSQKISTVIFDEVDTGISGEIARKVALKIKELSLICQVISITHLPQVASISDHHIKINKINKNGRTYTTIKDLTLEEKIYEVASMISDGNVTESQLAYAREMILQNE